MERVELNPGGVHFFGRGDENDFLALEKILESQQTTNKKIIALFTEYPSNPLLFCPDLKRYVCLFVCLFYFLFFVYII